MITISMSMIIIYHWLDWYKGNFLQETIDQSIEYIFPVDFPLNQSIESS